jgi:hypothetical protein
VISSGSCASRIFGLIRCVAGIASDSRGPPSNIWRYFPRHPIEVAHYQRECIVDIKQFVITGNGREAVTAAIFWLKVRAGWCDPVPVRQYPLGRKEARQVAAETAEVGTEWEDLLH